MSSTVVPRRQSARLLPGPSRLLSLSPELLDLIVNWLSRLERNKKVAHLDLSALLKVSPQLAPFARRYLFYKVAHHMGDARGEQLKQLVVNPGGQSSGVGEHVRILKVRAPNLPPDAEWEALHPAASLVPRTILSQTATIELVLSVLRFTPNLHSIEIDTRVGTNEVGPVEATNVTTAPAPTATLDELERELCKLDIKCLVFAVPNIHNALQSLADLSTNWISPYIGALGAWDSITVLDLWRVQLVLPSSHPVPKFRLHELVLVSCELGSEFELEWLLGEFGGSRSARLRKLVVHEVNFTSAPGSSNPLHAIFTSPSEHENTSPSFTSTLTFLELALPWPIDSASNLLTPLTSLLDLEFGGSGITPALFSSILPSLLPTSSSHIPTPSVSQSLTILHLHYVTSLPHPSLLSSFSNPHFFPNLKLLDIHQYENFIGGSDSWKSFGGVGGLALPCKLLV
ncbi:hypothetical protein RQP46_010825 [Phenoliferia psychrophenolica]